MTTLTISSDGGVHVWAAMSASQTGQTLAVKNRALVLGAVQVTGTFGGTVTLQGSLDGTNWFTIKDTRGNDCAFTAAALVELSSAVAFVRPITGVGVSSVVVRLAMGGA